MSLHPKEFLRQNLENPIIFVIENQTGGENITVSSVFLLLYRYNKLLIYSAFKCQINLKSMISKDYNIPISDVHAYPSLYDLNLGEKFTQTTEPGWLKN